VPTLLILFVTVPLGELFLLIEVGQAIGALPTIALCLLTAMLGASLLRQQGLQTLARARHNLDRGALPAIELLEAVALIIGGVLLLTPGLVTDVVGFACLIPPTRRFLVQWVLARLAVRVGPSGSSQGPGARDGDGGYTIEGDYARRDDEQRPPRD
jgi:UPF0716 protein FxsA